MVMGVKNMACGCQRCNCGVLAFIASVVVGIIAAILRYTAVITITPAFLWVVLGVAVVFLGASVFAAILGGNNVRRCFCEYFTLFVVGALGAILLSVVLLAIPFAATSLLGALISGAMIYAIAQVVTITACVLRCIISCSNQ